MLTPARHVFLDPFCAELIYTSLIFLKSTIKRCLLIWKLNNIVFVSTAGIVNSSDFVKVTTFMIAMCNYLENIRSVDAGL